ncbi:PIN domain-containing protein [Candidatus Saccharibacteria bacterium]|nr:PIN domain-containing protein [Candidatus Saccharibacteria bacterium]
MPEPFKSSLDTNLICRLIIGDVPAQREKAKHLLSDISHSFYVNDVVVAETIFVLSSVYCLEREKISEDLKNLFSLPNVSPESPFILDALDFYASHPSLSFVDCYSAFFAEANNKEPLLTFDRKLSRQHPSAKSL